MSGPADFMGAADRLSESVARLAANAAGYVGARLEQMDSAIQAERRRWLWMLLGAATVVLCLSVTAVFAGLAIVLTYWDSNRVLASVLVSAGYLVLATGAIIALWRCARRPATTADRIARILALFLEGRRLTR